MTQNGPRWFRNVNRGVLWLRRYADGSSWLHTTRCSLPICKHISHTPVKATIQLYNLVRRSEGDTNPADSHFQVQEHGGNLFAQNILRLTKPSSNNLLAVEIEQIVNEVMTEPEPPPASEEWRSGGWPFVSWMLEGLGITFESPWAPIVMDWARFLASSEPHTVVWDGGNLDWKPINRLHFDDAKTLCGLKICGYYETNMQVQVLPRCENCIRVVNGITPKAYIGKSPRR